MRNDLPAFLITIDTEGDDLWRAPRQVTTRNAAYLPRFQTLCERYGFKPTYLVNYEMALSPEFIELGRQVVTGGQGEIGMHLHAWNSPPITPLTSDDTRCMPYLIEYSEAVLRAKVAFMTRLLEDTFSVRVVSHRAGRWAFDSTYARALADEGYLADCSVTPYVDWGRVLGNPQGSGGTDYRCFPTEPYFLDLDEIKRSGESRLLEIPMTIETECPQVLRRGPGFALRRIELVDRVVGKIWPKRWLRPNGCNLGTMLDQVEKAAQSGAAYVEFMLHSSELMPGGSPTFATEESIARLYGDLEALFQQSSRLFAGATLAEFRSRYPSPMRADEEARLR